VLDLGLIAFGMMLAVAAFAVLGFWVGGSVVLLGRIGRFPRSAVRVASVAWVILCLAVVVLVMLRIKADQPAVLDPQASRTSNPLSSLGVGFYTFFGFASAIGGGLGFSRGASSADRGDGLFTHRFTGTQVAALAFFALTVLQLGLAAFYPLPPYHCASGSRALDPGDAPTLRGGIAIRHTALFAGAVTWAIWLGILFVGRSGFSRPTKVLGVLSIVAFPFAWTVGLLASSPCGF
jgi:hypothetical protein